ncbi:MAG: 1-acyl-sn-glycerol-3-phosphate acyltransferase [Lachnospiraceae bacterium]|nr:1-acyl-sn-glycerol-3-phosphate acyltransferase [Lachnospiraceae bacterium]
MQETHDIDRSKLIALINEYGGVDSYTTTQAATILEQIFRMAAAMGLDPWKRSDFFEASRRIFNIELINMDDLEHGRYVLVPNHVTEYDGLLFGTLIPNMLVVAKSDWITNPHLNELIERLFSIVGLVRKDNASGISVLRKCIDHLKASADSAVTVFVQQTIADIEITTPEDVASGVHYMAKKADAAIIPVYSEQVSPEFPTRIVFGDPIVCENKDDFGAAWLEAEFKLRDSITAPATRPPVLCAKHQKPISQRDF